MRQKREKTVITFASTTDAMAMEDVAARLRLPGRIIPVPTDISASCGLAWCVEQSERACLLEAIASQGIAHEGVFEVELY